MSVTLIGVPTSGFDDEIILFNDEDEHDDEETENERSDQKQKHISSLLRAWDKPGFFQAVLEKERREKRRQIARKNLHKVYQFGHGKPTYLIGRGNGAVRSILHRYNDGMRDVLEEEAWLYDCTYTVVSEIVHGLNRLFYDEVAALQWRHIRATGRRPPASVLKEHLDAGVGSNSVSRELGP
ncbi:MAG: hypothetical protein K2Z81_17050, partial [Cyanobacteria bacterium]|nr:hypothetical protein [Cyanobacteriota bacterium]